MSKPVSLKQSETKMYPFYWILVYIYIIIMSMGSPLDACNSEIYMQFTSAESQSHV